VLFALDKKISQNLPDYIPSRPPLIKRAIQVPRKELGYPGERFFASVPAKITAALHNKQFNGGIKVTNCPVLRGGLPGGGMGENDRSA